MAHMLQQASDLIRPLQTCQKAFVSSPYVKLHSCQAQPCSPATTFRPFPHSRKSFFLGPVLFFSNSINPTKLITNLSIPTPDNDSPSSQQQQQQHPSLDPIRPNSFPRDSVAATSPAGPSATPTAASTASARNASSKPYPLLFVPSSPSMREAFFSSSTKKNHAAALAQDGFDVSVMDIEIDMKVWDSKKTWERMKGAWIERMESFEEPPVVVCDSWAAMFVLAMLCERRTSQIVKSEGSSGIKHHSNASKGIQHLVLVNPASVLPEMHEVHTEVYKQLLQLTPKPIFQGVANLASLIPGVVGNRNRTNKNTPTNNTFLLGLPSIPSLPTLPPPPLPRLPSLVPLPEQDLITPQTLLALSRIYSQDQLQQYCDFALFCESKITASRLATIKCPTTIIVHATTALLHPNYERSHFLLQNIPNAFRFHFQKQDNKETILFNIDGFSLHQVIIEGLHLAKKKQSASKEKNHITTQNKAKKLRAKPIETPNRWQISKAKQQMIPINRFVSPIYINLNTVPKSMDRPILFVGNHTLYGLTDIPLFIGHYHDKRNILIRALGHPLLFGGPPGMEKQDEDKDKDKGNKQNKESKSTRRATNSMGSGLEKLGVMRVSPRGLYNVLAQNQHALLFPGGAREANKRRGEEYKLMWPKSSAEKNNAEFVRMVLKLNGLVVPFAAVGAEDNWKIIWDGDDILKTPIIGQQIKKSFDQIGLGQGDPARTWKVGEKEDPVLAANPKYSKDDDQDSDSQQQPVENTAADFIFPVSRPRTLARQYFYFGEPIDPRKGLQQNQDVREHCRRVYEDIENQVRAQLDKVLHIRKQDPYGDLTKRLAFENINHVTAPGPWSWSDFESNLDMETEEQVFTMDDLRNM